MEVLSNANRLALEGAQAVARRHMEIMQQTMTEFTEHARETHPCRIAAGQGSPPG